MATWSVPLRVLADKSIDRTEQVVRKATFDLFAAVVRRSPVDTGRFRANWNVSQGALDRSTTASTAAGRADAEIRKVLSFPVGGVTYLANSLPYAIRLEDGWSKQAPTGMVRVSTLEWRAKLLQALKSVR